MRGFNLLELLVVVIIVGCLVVGAVPSFRQLLIDNRAVSIMNSIVSALQYARSEAIAKGYNIEFCKSKDHKRCGGEWRDGQIVIDMSNKRILRIFPALATKDVLRFKGSFGKDSSLIFTSLGTTTSGRFDYYPSGDMNNGRAIIINRAGRIRKEKQ